MREKTDALSSLISPLGHALFQDTTDAIIVADKERRIARVNPAFTRLFGYEPSQVLGRQTAVLYASPGDFERQGAKRFNVSAREELAPYEVEYRTAEGRRFIGETVGSQIRDESGEVIGFIGLVCDVTQRAKVQQCLAELYETTSSAGLDTNEKLEAILRIGSDYFELPVGIISRIEGDRYEILHVSAPSQELGPGDVFPLGSTQCADTLRALSPIAYRHVGASGMRNHPCYRDFKLEAYIGAPVHVDGEPFGTVNFSCAEPRDRPFDHQDRELIRMLSQGFGTELAREIDWKRLNEARDRLQRLATTDELTSLPNRRDFMRRADGEIARGRRYERPTSILMVDVDHFKDVNDSYGHEAGDTVLAQIAAISRRVLRLSDVVGRIGGEEFAVRLPESDVSAGEMAAERLRSAIETEPVPIDAGKSVSVTISIGLATSESGESLQEVLRRADRALYEAKRSGRNCTVCSEPCAVEA